jgi:hypothetical protein
VLKAEAAAAAGDGSGGGGGASGSEERDRSGGGGGSSGSGGGSSGSGGGGPLPADAASTMAELQRLQAHLVALLQNEYFCDDLEPPAAAFGWGDQKLREYFESGGE